MKILQATQETVNAIRSINQEVYDLSGPPPAARDNIQLSFNDSPFKVYAVRFMNTIYIAAGTVSIGNFVLNIPASTVDASSIPSNTGTRYYLLLRIELKSQYIGQRILYSDVIDSYFTVSYHIKTGSGMDELNPVSAAWPWGNPYVAVILIAVLSGRTLSRQVVTENIHLEGRYGYAPHL